MNVSPHYRRRCLALMTLVVLALIGCASVREAVLPPVQLWQIAREVPGADPRWQRAEATKAGVRVWRGGSEIRAERLMTLLPGDEIETAANAAVVLRFRDSGDLLVLERTRVKIGSLEVSRLVFRSAGNKFSVSSETWWPACKAAFLWRSPERTVPSRRRRRVGAVRHECMAPVRLRATKPLSHYPIVCHRAHGGVAIELRAYEQLARLHGAPEQGWCAARPGPPSGRSVRRIFTRCGRCWRHAGPCPIPWAGVVAMDGLRARPGMSAKARAGNFSTAKREPRLAIRDHKRHQRAPRATQQKGSDDAWQQFQKGPDRSSCSAAT